MKVNKYVSKMALGTALLGSLGMMTGCSNDDVVEEEIEDVSEVDVATEDSDDEKKDAIEVNLDDYDYSAVSRVSMSINGEESVTREVIINQEIEKEELEGLAKALLQSFSEEDEDVNSITLNFNDRQAYTNYDPTLGSAIKEGDEISLDIKEKDWFARPEDRDVELFIKFEDASGSKEEAIDEVALAEEVPNGLVEDAVDMVEEWIGK